jgi:hypothetical protein
MTIALTVYALSNIGYADHYYVTSKLLGQALGSQMLQADEPAWKKTFEDVETVEEFGHWLRGGFMNTFFSKNTQDYDEFDTLPPGYTQDSNGGYVLGYNKILGGIRIAQARVKTRPCDGIPPQFQAAIPQSDRGFQTPVCFGDADGHFSEAVENRSSFGEFSPGIPFLYAGLESDAEPLNQDVASFRAKPFSTWSSMAYQASYPAPAFAVMLNPMEGKAAAHRTIHKLISGKYFDRQTRAVLVDVTLLNHQTRSLTWIRMAGEQSRAGGVTTTHDVVQFDPYLTGSWKNSTSYIVLVCFAVFYYLWLFWAYIKQLWNAKTVPIAVIVGGLDQVPGLANSRRAVYHQLPPALFNRGGAGLFHGGPISKAAARDALSLRCTAVFKQPGDSVRKGEPLYRLEGAGIANGGGGRRTVVCVCYSPVDATMRAVRLDHSISAGLDLNGYHIRTGMVAVELSVDRNDPILSQPYPEERLRAQKKRIRGNDHLEAASSPSFQLMDAALQLGGTSERSYYETTNRRPRRGAAKDKTSISDDSCCAPVWLFLSKIRHFFAHYPLCRLVELLNIGCFVAHCYFRWLAGTTLLPAVDEYNINGHQWIDFVPCALACCMATRLVGFCVLALWCRLALVSMTFIPSFRVVTCTLSKAAAPLGSVLCIYSMALIGFVGAYSCLYSSQLASFRDLPHTTMALLRLLLGDYAGAGIHVRTFSTGSGGGNLGGSADVVASGVDNSWCGGVLFVLFIGCTTLTLLGFTVSIFSVAYAEARGEISRRQRMAEGRTLDIYDSFSRWCIYRFTIVFGCCGCQVNENTAPAAGIDFREDCAPVTVAQERHGYSLNPESDVVDRGGYNTRYSATNHALGIRRIQRWWRVKSQLLHGRRAKAEPITTRVLLSIVRSDMRLILERLGVQYKGGSRGDYSFLEAHVTGIDQKLRQVIRLMAPDFDRRANDATYPTADYDRRQMAEAEAAVEGEGYLHVESSNYVQGAVASPQRRSTGQSIYQTSVRTKTNSYTAGADAGDTAGGLRMTNDKYRQERQERQNASSPAISHLRRTNETTAEGGDGIARTVVNEEEERRKWLSGI